MSSLLAIKRWSRNLKWGTVPLKPCTQQDFICSCWPYSYINFHAVCELTCSNDFRDNQGVLKLMVGARSPLCTIYLVTWYLRLLALSILTCSPNVSFLARLVSDNSGSLEKLKLGAPSSQPPLRKNYARGLSSCSWLSVRQIWRSLFY